MSARFPVRLVMQSGAILLAAAFVACPLYFLGCAHTRPRNDLTFSTFHNEEFQWRRVGRVLVLPVVNETAYPEGTEQIRRSMDAEFQQLGRFEVVPTPPHVAEKLARCVRETGRFDEAEVVDFARRTSADALVVVTLTHYSPYVRPRIGLTIQAISPDLGKIVAGVDGMWDTNNLDIADRAREYYKRRRTHVEHVADHVLETFDDAYGRDLAIESPHLFQRFVTSEAVRLLIGDPHLLASLRPAVPKPYEPRPMFAISLPRILHGLCGPCDPARMKNPTAPAKAAPGNAVPGNAAPGNAAPGKAANDSAAKVRPAANNSARNKP